MLDRIELRSTVTPAERLRTTMAAVRVSFTWFGVQKSLTAAQKAQAAEPFDAQGQFLSATKKLIDTKHTAYRAVTAIRGKIEAFWKSQSLPFPEAGVRLIRQDQVEAFARQIDDFKVELDDAVAELDRGFDELKQAARERLGSLFNPLDYPETLRGLFAVSYDFPSVEPPGYLVALSPGLYEQEQARVSARFEEAVRLAEEAFLAEFGRLVAHLTERLSGTNEDGTPKVFRDSAIANLIEFFDKFKQLNVRSNAQLDDLVAERGAAGDVRRRRRRTCGATAALCVSRVTMELSQGRRLDDLLVDRPRRRIWCARLLLDGRGVMQLVVEPTGRVRAIYSEELDLAARWAAPVDHSGAKSRRARLRTVAGRRTCAPAGGPVLGPFDRRSAAARSRARLAPKRTWLVAST